MTATKIINELKTLSNPSQSANYARFFKTWVGEYWEWDQFRWIKMSEIRKIAKDFSDIDFLQIKKLLQHPVHEVKMCGIVILVYNYPKHKQRTLDFYLENISRINNRDFVDTSTDKICGQFLLDFAGEEKAKILEKHLESLLISENLREKRIAIISTYQLIKNNQFSLALKFIEKLLNDKQDLIHKATWRMLREIRKRNNNLIETFIQKNYKKLHRTTLRYAIERFEEKKRKTFLSWNF